MLEPGVPGSKQTTAIWLSFFAAGGGSAIFLPQTERTINPESLGENLEGLIL
jgi:hypothetical protein